MHYASYSIKLLVIMATAKGKDKDLILTLNSSSLPSWKISLPGGAPSMIGPELPRSP